MGFSRQEYWSELPFPTPGDLSDPGIRSVSLGSPALTGGFFTAAAESLQSCPTLCDRIGGSPAGCPVSGILQARTLEWVAISFSNSSPFLTLGSFQMSQFFASGGQCIGASASASVLPMNIQD